MRIAQISDSHISLDKPGRLTDLRNAVQAVNASAPDVVVHTGDVAHNGQGEEYRQALEIMETLEAPFYVIPGNKDKRDELMQVFGDHLSVNDGYVQYQVNDYPVNMLFIDTVSDSSNKGQLCDTRLDYAVDVLEQDVNDPLVVFMHHTPFDVMEIPDPFQFEDRGQVDKLITAFLACRRLKAVYCGHVHRNVGVQIEGLSISTISCMASDLRKGQISEYERTRPMMRVLEV